MTDTPASLDALGIKPVAWIYKRHHFDEPLLRTIAELHRLPIGTTETPLYSADDLAPLIAKARRVEALEAALRAMLHAVCHETGFAAAVRQDSGLAYPWEPLDIAEAQARAALKENTDATSD